MKVALAVLVVLLWLWGTYRFVRFRYRQRARDCYGADLRPFPILSLAWLYQRNPAAGFFRFDQDQFDEYVEWASSETDKKQCLEIARGCLRMLRGPKGTEIRGVLAPLSKRGDDSEIRKVLPLAIRTVREQVRLGNSLLDGFGSYGGPAFIPVACFLWFFFHGF